MNAGRKMTLDECAHSCRGVSSMFTYGTNDFGKWFRTGLGPVWYCNDKNHRFPGCICNCVKSAVEGECPGGQTSKNLGVRLYKYESENVGKDKIKRARMNCSLKVDNIFKVCKFCLRTILFRLVLGS